MTFKKDLTPVDRLARELYGNWDFIVGKQNLKRPWWKRYPWNTVGKKKTKYPKL